MFPKDYGRRLLVGACSLALASLAGFAMAAGTNDTMHTGSTAKSDASLGKPRGDEGLDAQRQVDRAAQVVRRMESDRGAAQLLREAQGVFVVDRYGRAALGVGGRGGEGVLMVKRNGRWGDPAFYNAGGVSIGAEAGAEGGSMVFVLNDDRAVQSFKQNNNWSLNAEAGLTIVGWSGKAQGSAGKGDVTVWSDTKGLLGSVAISVTDIHFDQDETSAFYGKPMTVADVFGATATPTGNVAALRDALAANTVGNAH